MAGPLLQRRGLGRLGRLLAAACPRPAAAGRLVAGWDVSADGGLRRLTTWLNDAGWGHEAAGGSSSVASSGHHRQQGEPAAREQHWLGRAGPHSSYEGPHDLGWLYSLHATELQQQHFLRMGGAGGGPGPARAGGLDAATAGREGEGRAKAEAQAEADEREEVEVEVLRGGATSGLYSKSTPSAAQALEVEFESSLADSCALCEGCPAPDFYEGAGEFKEEQQLVLRSAWLCAGAGSLTAMRERLEERVRFLSDLEADGWQLEAPVDDEYACLRNVEPKPTHERRLADAWEIVERWERGVEWERWPGPDVGPW